MVVEAQTLETAITGRVVAVEGVVVVVGVAMVVMAETTAGMVVEEEEDTAVATVEVVMEEVEVRCNLAMLLGEPKVVCDCADANRIPLE